MRERRSGGGGRLSETSPSGWVAAPHRTWGGCTMTKGEANRFPEGYHPRDPIPDRGRRGEGPGLLRTGLRRQRANADAGPRRQGGPRRDRHWRLGDHARRRASGDGSAGAPGVRRRGREPPPVCAGRGHDGEEGGGGGSHASPTRGGQVLRRPDGHHRGTPSDTTGTSPLIRRTCRPTRWRAGPPPPASPAKSRPGPMRGRGQG